MADNGDSSRTEKWIPLAILLIAVAVGTVLYFTTGDAMTHLRLLAGYVALILVFAFGLLTLYAMACGKIDLTYLVSESNGQASMSRFQLLIFTFVIALSIVLMVVSSPQPKFPAIPNDVLILLGLSASTYAVSKGIQKSAETEQADIESKAPAQPPPEPPKAVAKGAGE